MKPLITPQRVAELAFRAPDLVAPDLIPPATIVAAQQKFIRPVFGALYDAMTAPSDPAPGSGSGSGSGSEGRYAAFVESYIAPPLALYVKALMMPSLAVQSGAAGVVEVAGKNVARVPDDRLRAAVTRLRSDAAALVRRAVEHVETNPDDYPEYDPRANILNRVSTEGGVVLPL